MSSTKTAKRQIDMGRLAQALSAPGNDTSVWVTLGRVDDDVDAIRWDTQGVGWVVDVTLQAGPLDQVGPVPCKLSSAYAGSERLESAPVERGCSVVVAIPGGNPNVGPLIIGRTSNRDGCEVPTSVNGQPINEAFALANHFLVTPHGQQQQFGGDVRHDAPNMSLRATVQAQLLGATVELAQDGATQAFVRGNQFQTAFDAFLTALDTAYAATLAPGPAKTAFSLAVAIFKQALQASLSTRVRGE